MTRDTAKMKGRQLVAAAAACALCGAMAVAARGAARPDFSGTWTLNRELSAFPREVGFDPDWQDSGSSGQSGSGRSGGGGGGRGGGRGSRTSSGGGGGSGRLSPTAHQESEEDSRKIKELVEVVKTPSARLTITQTDPAMIIVDDRDRRQTFHIGGKEDTIDLEAGPIGAITKWEDAQLVIRYLVEKDRELRYRYSREPGTSRLVVEVQFADHGRGELIKRVYDVAPPN